MRRETQTSDHSAVRARRQFSDGHDPVQHGYFHPAICAGNQSPGEVIAGEELVMSSSRQEYIGAVGMNILTHDRIITNKWDCTPGSMNFKQYKAAGYSL